MMEKKNNAQGCYESLPARVNQYPGVKERPKTPKNSVPDLKYRDLPPGVEHIGTIVQRAMTDILARCAGRKANTKKGIGQDGGLK